MLLAGPCDKRAWLRIHVHVYSFLGDEETRSDPEGPGYSGSRNSCVSVSRCFVLGRLGLISTTAAEPEQAESPTTPVDINESVPVLVPRSASKRRSQGLWWKSTYKTGIPAFCIICCLNLSGTSRRIYIG